MILLMLSLAVFAQEAPEEAPAEEAPAEEAPAEEAPAETAPAETAPAETAPAETAPENAARAAARAAAMAAAAAAREAAAEEAETAPEPAAEALPAPAAPAAPAKTGPTSGGFRIGTMERVDEAGARAVLILNPVDQVLLQVAPRAQVHLGRYAFEVELPAGAEIGPGGEIVAGTGLIKTGHWVKFSGPKSRTHHGIVTNIGFASAPHEYRLDSWGSSMQEMLATFLLQMGWQVQWDPEAPVGLRAMVGLANYPQRKHGGAGALEWGLFKVIPLSDGLSMVFEQDFLLEDLSPATLRPMLRWEQEAGTFDAGVQVPWGSWQNGRGPASIQLITQYRSRF